MNVVRTACNRDCPDACVLHATVEDGRIVSLRGEREHPVTAGFLCYRTSRFLERQYDPDRLTKPLLRDGGGELRPAGWDEALDRIARTMLRIREESGPAAILHYRSGGSLGMMKHVTDHLFERFGPVAMKSGDVCTGAGDVAQEIDFGVSDSNDLFDLKNSKNIVLWGKNPHVSNVHLLPVLLDAKRRGARILLIDPVHHRGAGLADRYVQPRPGGDIALALGACRILFDSGRADPDAAGYSDHLEELTASCRARSIAAWAEIAGVAVEEIAAIADAFAARPCAMLVGWGLQRRARGSAAVRSLDALATVSGNVGIAGGGVSYYFRRRSAFDLSFNRGLAAAPRTISEPILGKGILEARDPPIRMVWITAGNPVCMLPDSHTVARALESRELTVVADSFLTDTARVAHVVLPVSTMLEDDDLVGAYGHHWIAELRPAVPPPRGVLTDYEIVRALAPRVGLGEAFSDDAEAWKRRILKEGVALEDLRVGAVKNPRAAEIMFADRRFETPTGRVNLLCDADPTTPAATPDYPLLLMPISTDKAQSSQWLPGAQGGLAPVIVHPSSAPGFQDGDSAVLQSEIGEMQVVLRFDPRQRPGLAIAEKGGWLRKGRCANALIPAKESDAGGCAAYYETPVRLRRAAAQPIEANFSTSTT